MKFKVQVTGGGLQVESRLLQVDGFRLKVEGFRFEWQVEVEGHRLQVEV